MAVFKSFEKLTERSLLCEDSLELGRLDLLEVGGCKEDAGLLGESCPSAPMLVSTSSSSGASRIENRGAKTSEYRLATPSSST